MRDLGRQLARCVAIHIATHVARLGPFHPAALAVEVLHALPEELMRPKVQDTRRKESLLVCPGAVDEWEVLIVSWFGVPVEVRVRDLEA